VIEDLSSIVEGIVSQLGRAFFLSGFLPILIGVALNQYFIFAPEYADVEAVWNIFPAVTTPFLGLVSGEWLTTIVVSLLLSLVLLTLNMFVVKLFEGLAPGMKALLLPQYVRWQRRHRTLYAEIAARRAERRSLLADYEETGEYDEDADFAIQEALHELHRDKEKEEPIQALPYDRRRLTPTLFGNAWAVMEEAPLARYGIDSMVFWPYMRVVVGRENAGLLEQIDNQKLLVDITIHLALVMAILVVEGIIFAVARFQLAMLILAVICLLLFLAFYRAGVNYVRTMGVMVIQSFDLYRLKLLDAFGLARPEDLDEEYWIWTRLAAFLRRGEPFYFDMLERAHEGPKEGDEG
jgi:hypothetical protein